MQPLVLGTCVEPHDYLYGLPHNPLHPVSTQRTDTARLLVGKPRTSTFGAGSMYAWTWGGSSPEMSRGGDGAGVMRCGGGDGRGRADGLLDWKPH